MTIKKLEKNIVSEIKIPLESDFKYTSGNLVVIGGSKLFHGAPFLALGVSSRIAGMTYFYSQGIESDIINLLKSSLFSFIDISKYNLEEYLVKADVILIGPGMMKDQENNKYVDLFSKFQSKKWVLDGGILQSIEPSLFPKNSIITPNNKEYEMLFNKNIEALTLGEKAIHILKMSKEYGLNILYKEADINIICDKSECYFIDGSIIGMRKGGFGDILSSLVASIFLKNDVLLSMGAASLILKDAGMILSKAKGFMFNAQDMVEIIPQVFLDLIKN